MLGLSFIAKLTALLRLISTVLKVSWYGLLKRLVSSRTRASRSRRANTASKDGTSSIYLDDTIAASRAPGPIALPSQHTAPAIVARSRSEQSTPPRFLFEPPHGTRRKSPYLCHPAEPLSRSVSHPNLPFPSQVPLEGIAVPSPSNFGKLPTASSPSSPTCTPVHSRSPSPSRPHSLYPEAGYSIVVQDPDGVDIEATQSNGACSSGTTLGTAEPTTSQPSGYDLEPKAGPSSSPATPNPDNAQPSPQSKILQATPARVGADTDIVVDRLRKKGIRPITTDYVERHNRGIKILEITTIETVEPMTIEIHYGELPKQWEIRVHPEGTLYYYDPVRCIITDADITKPDVMQRLDSTIYELEAEKELFSTAFPSDYELVLELPPENHLKKTPDLLCYYYYVCHEARSMFWLNPMHAEPMLSEVSGVTQRTHLKYAIETQYWKHWELFPLEREIGEALLQEAIGILMAGGVDQVTSKTSTFPYKLADTKDLLELVRTVNFVKAANGYSAWVVGRLMATFYQTRFIHFHGQHAARINRDQTLYESSDDRKTLFITLLSPVLFFAPDVHMRHLGHVWNDYVVNEQMWHRFIDRLQEEWEKFLLPATVLLSANVAFLAIPSVDQTNQSPEFMSFGNATLPDVFKHFDFNAASPQRTFSQVCSYISVVASTATIILGLILDRRHQSDAYMTAFDAATELQKRRHPYFGMEPIAVLYSLPYASLMWGMIAFAVGVCALFFNGTTPSTRIPLGIICTVFIAATCWCLGTTWDRDHSWRDRVMETMPWIGRMLGYIQAQIACGVVKCMNKLAVQPNHPSGELPSSTAYEPSQSV